MGTQYIRMRDWRKNSNKFIVEKKTPWHKIQIRKSRTLSKIWDIIPLVICTSTHRIKFH
jgi:hypothetical protein